MTQPATSPEASSRRATASASTSPTFSPSSSEAPPAPACGRRCVTSSPIRATSPAPPPAWRRRRRPPGPARWPDPARMPLDDEGDCPLSLGETLADEPSPRLGGGVVAGHRHTPVQEPEVRGREELGHLVERGRHLLLPGGLENVGPHDRDEVF